MHTLIALLTAAAAASAVARPGPSPAGAPGSLSARLPAASRREYGPPAPDAPGSYGNRNLMEYLLPQILASRYLDSFEDRRPKALYVHPISELTKEIEHLQQLQEEEQVLNNYDGDAVNVDPVDEYGNIDVPSFIGPVELADDILPSYDGLRGYDQFEPEDAMPAQLSADELNRGMTAQTAAKLAEEAKREPPTPLHVVNLKNGSTTQQKQFALTPMDKEYFQPDENQIKSPKIPTGEVPMYHEGLGASVAMLVEPPRQTRQNPINLAKQKHLLEPDIAKLKTGLANKDYRLPVSLVPSNLRWLKINHPETIDALDDEERSHEDGDRPKQHQIHTLEAADPADSIYGVALVAAVGAALAMAIIGFAFGWYTLSKKAKAAADVDYPAYGVTGPALDSSGDRKLAHSAHMYHYQHQKQQIIAMERNGMDQQRPNSVSDPESEEDNEEGDYTVYECPGFATTGDMEVKNPLFSEDPTPVTPGKCEVVKPQPKE